MSNELTQIVPLLRQLNRPEKLYVIQLLASDLAQEEKVWFTPGQEYPVWSPFDAFSAAQTMLAALAELEVTPKNLKIAPIH